MAAVKRQNITLDPEVFKEFCHYAGKKGIKISTWVNLKMKEFIEEENFFSIPVQPFILMKTADDTFVPWQPSQSDVLAEDWAEIK